ncbi:MAG: hypothetical protein ABI585_14375 [Betaproteobacteria bacterium]
MGRPTETTPFTPSARAGRRRAIAALLAAVFAAPLAACAHSPAPIVSSHLATVEVVDRANNTLLPVYVAGGERWIVGTPGHEYAIRIRNHTGTRILAVPSVDGVNAVTGETASPEQSGYVLEPYGSVEIAGWRKSLTHTAAFYFTNLADSYAARTGRPGDVGVIGLAVFRERVPIAYAPQPRIAERRAERADAPASAAPYPSAEQGAAAGSMNKERDSSDQLAGARQKSADAKLGTGHGRNETSYAQRVAFERASSAPESVVAIRYDRREALVARGIIPGPRYADRTPSAFPAWPGFTPDPR